MCYSPKQGINLFVADGRVDEMTKLHKLILRESAMLALIHKPESLKDWRQSTLMQLKIPAQQSLQPPWLLVRQICAATIGVPQPLC